MEGGEPVNRLHNFHDHGRTKVWKFDAQILLIRQCAVRYPGVPAASMRMYVYPVFELDHAVPFPPASGISGSQCFYSCSTALVGGNGMVWSSSNTSYTYFRIDTASTPGYLTAA